MSAPERGVAVWRTHDGTYYEDDRPESFADSRWYRVFPEAEAAALVAAERVVEAAQLFVERWHADHTHDPLGLVTALSDYDAARGAS